MLRISWKIYFKMRQKRWDTSLLLLLNYILPLKSETLPYPSKSPCSCNGHSLSSRSWSMSWNEVYRRRKLIWRPVKLQQKEQYIRIVLYDLCNFTIMTSERKNNSLLTKGTIYFESKIFDEFINNVH